MTHYTYRTTASSGRPKTATTSGLWAEFPSLSWLTPTKPEARAGIARLVAE